MENQQYLLYGLLFFVFLFFIYMIYKTYTYSREVTQIATQLSDSLTEQSQNISTQSKKLKEEARKIKIVNVPNYVSCTPITCPQDQQTCQSLQDRIIIIQNNLKAMDNSKGLLPAMKMQQESLEQELQNLQTQYQELQCTNGAIEEEILDDSTCQSLRDKILNNQNQIQKLRRQARNTPRYLRAPITNQIRSKREKINELKDRYDNLGCSPALEKPSEPTPEKPKPEEVKSPEPTPEKPSEPTPVKPPEKQLTPEKPSEPTPVKPPPVMPQEPIIENPRYKINRTNIDIIQKDINKLKNQMKKASIAIKPFLESKIKAKRNELKKYEDELKKLQCP